MALGRCQGLCPPCRQFLPLLPQDTEGVVAPTTLFPPVHLPPIPLATSFLSCTMPDRPMLSPESCLHLLRSLSSRDYSPPPLGHSAQSLTSHRGTSPRVRHAIFLHEAGIVKTKSAAARAVGLSPDTLYNRSMPGLNEDTLSPIREEAQAHVASRMLNVRSLLDQLSVRAVQKLGQLMETGEKEETQLRAAIDLADRGTETAKIQKVEIAPTLSAAAIEALREGLRESRLATQEHAGLLSGDLVRVQDDRPAVAEPEAPPS